MSTCVQTILFYQLTMNNPHTRFFMELDAAGYAEPVKPWPGLNIQQRLSILRDHISRRRSLTPCRVDTIWTDRGFRDLRNLYPQFVGGTFACLTQDVLEVVELPSPNEGTALSRRTILDETLPGVGYPDEIRDFGYILTWICLCCAAALMTIVGRWYA